MPSCASLEMFDDVQRMQHRLDVDFARHDARQQRFQKQLEREQRRSNHAISATAFAMHTAFSSNAVLFQSTQDAVEDADADADPSTKVSESPNSALSKPAMRLARQLRRLQNPATQQRLQQLKCFYLPRDVSADIVCENCGAFRTAALVRALPEPWQEFLCPDTQRHYYYDRETHRVMWTPPAGTDPFSVLVFERTKSTASICHCIPSRERRARMLHKLRMYAESIAREETDKRNMQLHGAFKTIAHSLLKKK